MNISIVNPMIDKNWDRSIPQYDDELPVFYSRAWANALTSSYGYKPLYFSISDNGHLRAFIPVMEIDSLLTGRRGVALPFTDTCDPLVSCKEDFAALLGAILAHGKSSDWKYFELRGGYDYLAHETPSETFIEHQIDLKPSLDSIEQNIRNSFKRNIQKSIRNNVKIKIAQTRQAFRHFIDLNSLTRRRHGIPPQPKAFFRNLYNSCIKDHGFVFLAIHDQKVIASAIFLTHQKHVTYKYGASDFGFQNLRPNNLLIYEALKFFKERGYQRLTLGRTHPGNAGLIQFKNGLTKMTNAVHYYRYNFSKGEFVQVNGGLEKFNPIFNRMPISLLNFAGKIFYKHMG